MPFVELFSITAVTQQTLSELHIKSMKEWVRNHFQEQSLVPYLWILMTRLVVSLKQDETHVAIFFVLVAKTTEGTCT